MIVKPNKKETIEIMLIIFEFFNPEYLNMLISLLLNRLIKKSWVEIKNMKGNISKIKVGELRIDKKSGK